MSDFANIGGYGHTGYTPLANIKSSGAKTAQQFIEYGRKNHGQLTLWLFSARQARPTSSRIILTPLPRWAGAKIPFKSAADAVAAVVTGTIDVYFAGPATAVGALGHPDLAVLAVTGKGRSSLLPNVPTFAELGINLNDSYTLGVFAPAGTPQPILDKLRKALEDAKKNPREPPQGRGDRPSDV